MNQLALFDEPPRARRRDPVTSKKAARKAVNFRAKHEAKIWADLKDNGAAICELISKRTGMDEVAVARRMSGMEERGLVKRDGVGVNRRGNECTKWRVAWTTQSGRLTERK